jgi:hypothetical protein
MRFQKILIKDCRRFPIHQVNLTAPHDGDYHDRIVTLVMQMLGLQNLLATARMPYERASLQRQITATDLQIDDLVYQLYGLTSEEITLVEQATR